MAMDEIVLYLLPGLLCDEAIWRHQTTALGALGLRTQVPDFRHCDSIAAMARHVLADAPEQFALAGHSMGARVAIDILRLAPERVARLALLDTGTHPRRDGEAEKRQNLVDLARAEGMAALARRWLPPMLHPRRVADAALMAELTAMVERQSPEIFARQVRALLDRPDAQAVLGHIACPVLLGVGRQDGWSPPAQHEAMARAIPQARLVVFEDSGHMAPVEAPDAVTAALRAWLGPNGA
jgi:pimeloyl-ACP methyl ester carboxylesterase